MESHLDWEISLSDKILYFSSSIQQYNWITVIHPNIAPNIKLQFNNLHYDYFV